MGTGLFSKLQAIRRNLFVFNWVRVLKVYAFLFKKFHQLLELAFRNVCDDDVVFIHTYIITGVDYLVKTYLASSGFPPRSIQRLYAHPGQYPRLRASSRSSLYVRAWASSFRRIRLNILGSITANSPGV